jgi:hypothetical protein
MEKSEIKKRKGNTMNFFEGTDPISEC